MLKIIGTECNGRVNPLCVDTAHPYFSATAQCDRNGAIFAAYQIQCSENPLFIPCIWDSGKVHDCGMQHIVYDGEALRSHTRYYYHIRCWDDAGQPSDWSDTGFFDTAFLGKAWTARFISCMEADAQKEPSPCTQLRRVFTLAEDVNFAKAYVTAKGLYELKINGQKAGNAFFTPGCKSYAHNLPYQAYDITSLLSKGENCVSVLLGDGWYKGYVNWNFRRNFYGDRRELLLELHIQLKSGEKIIVTSDDSFQWRVSPVGVSEFYIGETYDARKEMPLFEVAGCQCEDLPYAFITDSTVEHVFPEQAPPVSCVMHMKPIALLKTPKGEQVLDMGQNLVGVMSFTVRGNKGDRVFLKHGEVLDAEGNFYDDNIKNSVGPSSQDIVYILRGEGEERFTPHFTYQAFRYVKIVEYPGMVSLDCFEALILSSVHAQTGSFECSSEAVNRLFENIVWSQRGNFIDIPIAGPQRGERVGWTGDAQIFAPTACMTGNVRLFYEKWLDDLAADQFENGAVGWMIPHVCKKEDYKNDRLDSDGERFPTSAAWGDAALIVPWLLYCEYGDKDILEKQYTSMKRYVEFMRHSGSDPYTFEEGFHYGDWFALDDPDGSYYGATPKPFIATAYYAYSTQVLMNTAHILGITADKEQYTELYHGILSDMGKRYIGTTGELLIQTQTACALALTFHLFENHRCKIAEQLRRLVMKSEGYLNTGFVGTPLLCPALSENGSADLAYRLLLNRECPSWLYEVDHGATTIWEHWNGIKENGEFWDPWMNSFNHYAYGCIGKWLYSYVCGIQSDAENPGYRHFLVKPILGGGLTYARAAIQTGYGQVLSEWHKKNGTVVFEVAVPFGSSCTFIFSQLSDLESACQHLDAQGYPCKISVEGVSVTLKSGSWILKLPQEVMNY